MAIPGKHFREEGFRFFKDVCGPAPPGVKVYATPAQVPKDPGIYWAKTGDGVCAVKREATKVTTTTIASGRKIFHKSQIAKVLTQNQFDKEAGYQMVRDNYQSRGNYIKTGSINTRGRHL